MPNNRILITGANGQLGSELVELYQHSGNEVYGLSKNQLNVTNSKQVKEIIETIKPNIVIHTAAYTKVDQAENNSKLAFLINSAGTRNIALSSESVGAKLVYISTDYVFNGKKGQPYNETDMTAPLGVYGKSKLEGEQLVKKLCKEYFIVRTSWVFGKYGNNFVKTMLKLAKTQKELKVVNDQIGSPTYTKDLSECIFRLLGTEKYGTYHISNSGECSWYEFSKAIFDICGINVDVRPVNSYEFPSAARRPDYSVLDHRALKINGFPEMRHWMVAVKDLLDSYFKESSLFH